MIGLHRTGAADAERHADVTTPWAAVSIVTFALNHSVSTARTRRAERRSQNNDPACTRHLARQTRSRV